MHSSTSFPSPEISPSCGIESIGSGRLTASRSLNSSRTACHRWVKVPSSNCQFDPEPILLSRLLLMPSKTHRLSQRFAPIRPDSLPFLPIDSPSIDHFLAQLRIGDWEPHRIFLDDPSAIGSQHRVEIPKRYFGDH